MKQADQVVVEERSTAGKNFHSESFRLRLNEVGEKSSTVTDHTKIKVDTDYYSHYIE